MWEKIPLNRTARDFKEMMEVLNKRYDQPLRTYFSQRARMKLYNKCHDSITAVIKDIQHVATATDICSSCATEPHVNRPCSSRCRKNLRQRLAGCVSRWMGRDGCGQDFKSLCSQGETDPAVSGQGSIACTDLLTQFITTFTLTHTDTHTHILRRKTLPRTMSYWCSTPNLIFCLSCERIARHCPSWGVPLIGHQCGEQPVRRSHRVCLSNILAALGRRAWEIDLAASGARWSVFVCEKKR